MTARKRLARTAGLAWILMGVTSTSISMGILSVPRLFVVRNDAAATAQKILASETLFRMAIASEILSQTIFLLMGLTFYRLLNEVQRDWARAMVVLVAVGAAIGFANCLNLVMPLILLRGPTFVDFTPAQLEQLAYAFLRLKGFGFTILTWFLGLWLVPLGMLVARSGFFPQILGPLVIFGGVAHAIYALVVIISPATAPTFFKYVTQPSGALGEAPLLLWLLIKGADERRTTVSLPEGDAGFQED